MVNANGASTTALTKQSNNGDVRNRAGIASYTKHWNADSTKDTAEQMDARKESYTDVVVSCLLLVVLLCNSC
jgi:sterol 24-C-methyltransferase